MRPVLTALIALTASVGALRAQSSQPPVTDRGRFVSASSELVVLPVVVTDRQDRFVADLAQDRFLVLDNGRPQAIALFTNEDTPVTVGLVIDDSRSMAPKLAEVIAAAAAFARSSNPQDELFAVAFNDTVQEHIGGRALSVTDPADLENALSALVPQGRTALYDALVAALQRAAETTRPRKVLILISDGGDNASETTLKQVLARARQSNVTIYTIGLFDADDADRNPGVLKSLAQATGGERFLPDTPARLMQACQHIAREIRSGYTIGYVPPDRDGAYHRVQVDVRPPDGRRISVRTRPGYFAASPVTRP
jgi:Ca-activated chloride channel homolog